MGNSRPDTSTNTSEESWPGRPPRCSLGIPGLDRVLGGGLPPRRAYLVRGGPGCGKTTLGFHFLTDGAKAGQPVLCITLGESAGQLRNNAANQGMDLEAIEILDLSPTQNFFEESESYSIFSSAEVEGKPIADEVKAAIERVKPARVFIDSVTQLRHLSNDPYQFRKQVLSLVQYLIAAGATTIFSSESLGDSDDEDVQFMSDGIIVLDSTDKGRVVRVTKMRGSDFLSGDHGVRLDTTGMTVFPALRPDRHGRDFEYEKVASGIPDLDSMLGGGLERGTTTLISGPTGVGKTTVGAQFMKEAAGRGDRSVVFTFEEDSGTFLHRCESLNVPARQMVENGRLAVHYIEPAYYGPDEFAGMVREEVEKHDTRIVMIDSTSGYRIALKGEEATIHLHSLCRYLKNMGVTTILIDETEGIGTGIGSASGIGVSYLADTIIVMRYLEFRAELLKTIGVLKKRTSDFERTMRELKITPHGLKLGEPLLRLKGLLTGDSQLGGDIEKDARRLSG